MKIKKLIALVLVLAMSLSVLPVSASAYSTLDAWLEKKNTPKPEFEIINDGVLAAYNGDGGDVVVPDGVVEVGNDVFSDNDTITSLTIPEGCKKIGRIICCANLTTLIFPYSAELIDIDKSITAGMPSLRKIVIPNELTEIPSYRSFPLRGTILIDGNGKMTQAEPGIKPDGVFKVTLTVPQEFNNDRWYADIQYTVTTGSFYVTNGQPYGDILKIGPKGLTWETGTEGYGKPITPLWKEFYWVDESGKVVTPETIVDLTKDTVITPHHPELDELHKPVNIDNSMSAWAKADIEAAEAAGLLTDELKSNFTANITREEFCMLMVKLVEAKTGMNVSDYILSKGTYLYGAFQDISNALYISPAYTLGIINGVGNNRFNPTGTISYKESSRPIAART